MAGKSERSRRTAPVDTRQTKKNLLKTLGVTTVDHKDTARLRLFISDRGKIRSRRVTGLTEQQQRRIALAIKNAREMALLPELKSRGPSVPRVASSRPDDMSPE